MAYLTLKDFIDKWGAGFLLSAVNDRVTGVSEADLETYAAGGDPSPSDGLVEIQTAFDEALSGVTSDINGYIGTALDFPLTKTPLMLERKAQVLVAYELVKAPNAWLQREKREALEWLKDVSKGLITLGVDASGSEVDNKQKAQSVGRDEAASNVFSTDSARRRFEGGGYEYGSSIGPY